MEFLLLFTLARPPTSFSLRTTYRSFQYASSCLWNQLSTTLRQPHPILSYISDLPFLPLLFMCRLTTLTVRSSFVLSLPAPNLPLSQIFPLQTLLASAPTPRTSWPECLSSEYLAFVFSFLRYYLWPPCVIGQSIIFLLCGFFFLFLSSSFPCLITAVGDWMSTILPYMVWPS